MTKPISNKLYNSLIEYLVVAGCDQDTNLIVNSDQEVCNFNNFNY